MRLVNERRLQRKRLLFFLYSEKAEVELTKDHIVFLAQGDNAIEVVPMAQPAEPAPEV
jgi:hypothetical protein